MSVRDGLIGTQGLESPAPMPDKIFRLRTGPEEKMDAFVGEATEIPRVCKKLGPADEDEDSEHDEMLDFMFVKCFLDKLISTCLYPN